jgi:hypothetical protein
LPAAQFLDRSQHLSRSLDQPALGHLVHHPQFVAGASHEWPVLVRTTAREDLGLSVDEQGGGWTQAGLHRPGEGAGSARPVELREATLGTGGGKESGWAFQGRPARSASERLVANGVAVAQVDDRLIDASGLPRCEDAGELRASVSHHPHGRQPQRFLEE